MVSDNLFSLVSTFASRSADELGKYWDSLLTGAQENDDLNSTQAGFIYDVESAAGRFK